MVFELAARLLQGSCMRPDHQVKLAQAVCPGVANANRLIGTVLLLAAFTGSANARCEDTPRPNVDWTNCSKKQLMLSNDDLTRAVLSRARLTATNFARSRLSRAQLIGAEISFTHFGEADLSGAGFARAVGLRANFSRANLERTRFYGADMSRALFVEAKLAGGELHEVRDEPV